MKLMKLIQLLSSRQFWFADEPDLWVFSCRMDFERSSASTSQSDYSQASVVSLGPSIHSIQAGDGDHESSPLLSDSSTERNEQRQGRAFLIFYSFDCWCFNRNSIRLKCWYLLNIMNYGFGTTCWTWLSVTLRPFIDFYGATACNDASLRESRE